MKKKTYQDVVDEVNNDDRARFLEGIKILNESRSRKRKERKKLPVDKKFFKEQILHCNMCKYRIKCSLTGRDDAIAKKYADSVLFEIYRQAKVNYKEEQFQAGRYFQQQYTNVLSSSMGYRHKLRKFVGTMLEEVSKCNLLNEHE